MGRKGGRIPGKNRSLPSVGSAALQATRGGGPSHLEIMRQIRRDPQLNEWFTKLTVLRNLEEAEAIQRISQLRRAIGNNPKIELELTDLVVQKGLPFEEALRQVLQEKK